jgi:uncharacterized protein
MLFQLLNVMPFLNNLQIGGNKMSDRNIRVRGSAKVTAAPDWVIINFDVESRQYSYAECMAQLNQKTEYLRSELQKVGLDKDSLKTTQFNIDTNFDWVKDKHVFRGYKATHDLTVEFPFNKEYLNQVLDVLGHTESKASFRILFIVKEPEPLRQQALAEAVKNCRQKAEVLAEAAGVKLGELQHIDYSWSELHFEHKMYVCESSAPLERPAPAYDIEPDDVNVSDSVTVIWAIS